VAAAYSTERTLGTLFYSYHNVFVNSPNSIRFTADYSGLRDLNFYGLGNNTHGEEDEAEFFASDSRYLVTGVDHIWERRRNKFTTGLKFSYSEDLKDDVTFVSLDQPYGYGKFSAVSVATEYQYDSRDLPVYPQRGVFFKAGGSFTPELLDVAQGSFGEGHAQLTGFTTPILGVTAAARVSGKKLWGTFPYFESAFIGGARTVRGFEANRFAGDTSVYGNVELRFKAFDSYFLVPGEVGLFLLADTGRVYVEGDSPGGWHNGAGFGVWGAAIDRFSTMSLSFAWGDRFSVYYAYGFAY